MIALVLQLRKAWRLLIAGTNSVGWQRQRHDWCQLIEHRVCRLLHRRNVHEIGFRSNCQTPDANKYDLVVVATPLQALRLLTQCAFVRFTMSVLPRRTIIRPDIKRQARHDVLIWTAKSVFASLCWRKAVTARRILCAGFRACKQWSLRLGEPR